MLGTCDSPWENSMKLAFSNMICPAWDFEKLAEAARRYGFAGVDLGPPSGHPQLFKLLKTPADRDAVRQEFREAGLQFACVSASDVLYSRDGEAVGSVIARIGEHLKLARELDCPFVRVFPGPVSSSEGEGLCRERRESRLARICDVVRAIVPHAVEHRVTVLVENAGEFVDSASVWQIVEAAGSPMVKCCWNPSAARHAKERSTTAIPRLSSKLGLVRLRLGELIAAAASTSAAPAVDVEIPRLIQLLKGIAYQGYLVVDLPGGGGSADPETTLPAAAAYLQKLLEEKPLVLTAYKGDKYRPRQGHEFTVPH
jgi:sugar phosphate isomerase/epimerase